MRSTTNALSDCWSGIKNDVIVIDNEKLIIYDNKVKLSHCTMYGDAFPGIHMK